MRKAGTAGWPSPLCYLLCIFLPLLLFFGLLPLPFFKLTLAFFALKEFLNRREKASGHRVNLGLRKACAVFLLFYGYHLQKVLIMLGEIHKANSVPCRGIKPGSGGGWYETLNPFSFAFKKPCFIRGKNGYLSTSSRCYLPLITATPIRAVKGRVVFCFAKSPPLNP